MNSDIRLSIAFKGHRKRKKLRRLIGERSDSYLIDLWLTVALDRPDGILTGWSADDIADSCGWEGDPKILVDALEESGWIDYENDGVMSIHDWHDHQAWACKAKDRSEQARKAADKRWGPKKIKEAGTKNHHGMDNSALNDADSMLTALPAAKTSIAVGNAPILSLPILSNNTYPSNSGLKTESIDTKIPTPLDDPVGSSDVGYRKDKIIYPEPFEKFWAAYPRKVGKVVALKAYKNIKEPRPTLKQIVESVQAHSKTEQWQTKQHIPHPSTYLNERRWEDELTDDDYMHPPTNRHQPQIEYGELE